MARACTSLLNKPVSERRSRLPGNAAGAVGQAASPVTAKLVSVGIKCLAVLQGTRYCDAPHISRV